VEFKGVAAAAGIGIGRAVVVTSPPPGGTGPAGSAGRDAAEEKISAEAVSQELERFWAAVASVRAALTRLRGELARTAGEEKAAIIDAQAMMLDDPAFVDAVRDAITAGHKPAVQAVEDVAARLAAGLAAVEDEYIRQRAVDIRDLGRQLVEALTGETSGEPVAGVVVTSELTPSQAAAMDPGRVEGVVAGAGGATAHAAFILAARGIPAVFGVGDHWAQVRDGDTVVVDGNRGLVAVNPSPQELDAFLVQKAAWQAEQAALVRLRHKPAETADGLRRVELGANIGGPADVAAALAAGAEGVGLFRTEFLFLDRPDLPSEEEQFQVYKAVLAGMGGRPVIIRTLDAGGDKPVPALGLGPETNPFLGYRAIRVCLDRTDVFATQLRALLRASVHGRLLIMFPFIATVAEVRQAKGVLAAVKAGLDREGIPYDPHVQVGVMIEIPSAAVTADLIAREVDFFSIGSNDLTQYTLAVDRTNEKVAAYYDSLHPAVLRLCKNVIDAAHAAGIWAGMCGEMAGDPRAIPVLLGLGLDEFSMSPAALPKAREIIRSLTLAEAQAYARAALQQS